VLFDEDNAVTKRKGFVSCGSLDGYSYTGMWSYTDASNQAWLIVRASDSIRAASTPCNFTVTIATLTATDTVNAVNAFGRIYFVDPTQGVYSWNGTSTTYVSGSPRGTLIAEFRNRVWVSGLAVPNGNLLYGSKYLDGTTWTTGSLTTDPVILTVGLQDNFDNVAGLFSGYNDMLTVFKSHSVYGLYGFDQSDFSLRILNREVGLVDQRSVQPYLGGLIFMSQRGVEFFDGLNATLISKNIKDKIDPATFSSLNQRAVVQTTQADFQAGSSSPTVWGVNFTQVPNSVVVASQAYILTTDADWATTTITNGVAINNSVKTATSSITDVADPSFEIGSIWAGGSGWSRETIGTPTSHCGTLGAQSGSWFEQFNGPSSGYTATVSITGTQDSIAYASVSLPYSNSNCSYVTATLTGNTTYQRKEARVKLCVGSDCVQSLPFVYSGTDMTFKWASDNGATFFTSNGYMFIDNFSGGRINGPGFDITYNLQPGTSNYYLQPDVSWTLDGNTPTVAVDQSLDGVSWNPDVITSSGTSAHIIYPYARVRVAVGYTTGNNSNTSIDDITVTVRSTGTFLSSVINTSNITGWGQFTANQTLNGGTITYYTRSSTSSFTVNSSTPSFVAQTNGGPVAASTGTYTQVRADFVISLATQAPTLTDFTIGWNEGTARPPMASAVYDNRYWLALASTTVATQNTGIFVLSKGPIWTVFNIQAGALGIYKGNIYHTNNSSNGKVYLDWQGYNDDGAAINAFVRSKDFTPDGFMTDKIVKSLHLLAEPLGSYTLNSAYEVDRSGTLYSFSPSTVSELSGVTSLNLPVPASTSYAPYGKSLSLRFGNDTVDQPMKVYGGALVYSPRPIIQ